MDLYVFNKHTLNKQRMSTLFLVGFYTCVYVNKTAIHFREGDPRKIIIPPDLKWPLHGHCLGPKKQ